MPLTANRDLSHLIDQELRALKIKAATHIYRGSFVGLDRASGYVRPLAAGDLFVGVAYEECDNSAGANGDRACRIYTQGDFQTLLASSSPTDIGKPLFASDDGTLTLSGGGNASYVGSCVDVPASGKAIVRIEPHVLTQNIRTSTTPLSSLTSGATSQGVMIAQRPLVIQSAHVVFNTKPDAGALDVGTGNTNPTEIVSGFALSGLTNHVPATLTLAGAAVAAGARVWARVGQATSTPGVAGLLVLRFIELP